MRSCPLEPTAPEPELWASSRSPVLSAKVWGRPVSAVGHSSNDDEKNDKELGHLFKKESSPPSWPGFP